MYSPGVLAPHSPRSLQFSESTAVLLLSLSLSLSPRTLSPILAVFIIRSRSFLLLVRHTNSPSAISPHVRVITSHSLQPRVDSLITFFFIIGRHNTLCIFLAILFSQFYCTTVLFVPRLQAVRTRGRDTRSSLSLSSIDPLVLSLSPRLGVGCLSGVWE